MQEDNLVECRIPRVALELRDALTEVVLQWGAPRLSQRAIEAEVEKFSWEWESRRRVPTETLPTTKNC